jgi:hypothetical protein
MTTIWFGFAVLISLGALFDWTAVLCLFNSIKFNAFSSLMIQNPISQSKSMGMADLYIKARGVRVDSSSHGRGFFGLLSLISLPLIQNSGIFTTFCSFHIFVGLW